jgi:UDP-N-acetylglucosamine 2-epimerase (non-hydrolysing)
MKVLSVVGARPNYVKLAAVHDVFSKFFDHVVVDTGQHYDYEMNRVFFEQLEIPEPDYFLGVGSGSHGYQVGEVVKRVEEVLLRERPDLVVVYGDTNSTLGGALAAVKAGFRVAHVEAGLRCFDMSMPEEVNRRVVDHVSHLLFAPTESARRNLLAERVPGAVYLTGDVHVRALRRWLPVAEERSRVLERLGLEPGYAVVTVHRAENVDDPSRLSGVARLVAGLAESARVVFPVHPRTRKRLAEAGLWERLARSGIALTEPLGYLDFLKLLNNSSLVVTDSGGVQREAYLLRKPVVVLRRVTEWVELVEAGLALLRDPEGDLDPDAILSWRPRRFVEGLLGDERAPERIAEAMRKYLEGVRSGSSLGSSFGRLC